jgi:hypothetical protein
MLRPVPWVFASQMARIPLRSAVAVSSQRYDPSRRGRLSFDIEKFRGRRRPQILAHRFPRAPQGAITKLGINIFSTRQVGRNMAISIDNVS